MLEDDKPLFNVGNRVLITNPLDFFADDDKTVYTIEAVKFSHEHDVFAYKLSGGTAWINEAWLEPDIFGPQVIGVEKPKADERQALMAEIDYELASLFSAMNRGNDADKARSMARLSEIHVELYTDTEQ